MNQAAADAIIETRNKVRELVEVVNKNSAGLKKLKKSFDEANEKLSKLIEQIKEERVQQRRQQALELKRAKRSSERPIGSHRP